MTLYRPCVCPRVPDGITPTTDCSIHAHLVRPATIPTNPAIHLTREQAHAALTGHDPQLILRGRLTIPGCECGTDDTTRAYAHHLLDLLEEASTRPTGNTR